MPYNLFGEWIPEKIEPTVKKPIKVRYVKRAQSELTVIYNLDGEKDKMEEIASFLKRKLGCGGAVKGSDIEIQGNKVEAVLKALAQKGIKASE